MWFLFLQYYTATKAITSVGCPKMKRDAEVKAVFLLRKKTALTPASLFIFGRQTDVTVYYLRLYGVRSTKFLTYFDHCAQWLARKHIGRMNSGCDVV